MRLILTWIGDAAAALAALLAHDLRGIGDRLRRALLAAIILFANAIVTPAVKPVLTLQQKVLDSASHSGLG